MENWSYALLSQKAKTYGGPEKMLETIEAGAELKGTLKGGAIMAGALCASYGAFRLGKWAVSKLKKKFEHDSMLEQELIRGINEYENMLEEREQDSETEEI